MKATKAVLIPAALLVGVAAFAFSSNVLLATKKLAGGLATQKVDSSAIPSGGTKMVGKIVNDSKRPITDLTISVTGDKTDAGTGKQAPTSSGGSKVTGPNGSSESNHGSRPGGDGYTTTVDFTNSGGAGALPPGGTMEVEVDIGNPGTAGLINVHYTPSVSDKPKDSSAAADMLRTAELSVPSPGQILAMIDAGHSRSSAYFTNDEKPGNGAASITALVGSVTSLPAGITLTSVHLQDPSANFAMPNGTTILLDGANFSITGFTALGPGETYELIVVLSARPSAPYKVMVDATF
jgi:hypothetical protein